MQNAPASRHDGLSRLTTLTAPQPSADVSRAAIDEGLQHERRLGDLVTVPGHAPAVLRAQATLPRAAAGIGSFLLLGECDCIVAYGDGITSTTAKAYVPRHEPPAAVRRGDVLAEGLSTYLAPHMPMWTTALAEVRWRVIRVPGWVDPAIALWRGPQVIVFVRGGLLDAGDTETLHTRGASVYGAAHRQAIGLTS